MKNRKRSPLEQRLAGAPKASPAPLPTRPTTSSMLDVMKDGNEYASLLQYQYVKFDLINELRRSIDEISAIRKREVICYVANVVTARRGVVSIDNSDDLPFNEMISTLPQECKEVD